MATNSTNLQSLFEKYMNNSCTKEEWEELLQLVREETHEPNLQQAFKAYWNKLSTIESNPDYWNEKFNEVLAQAKADSVPVVRMKSRTRWIKWVAAACIILLIGVATYTIISKRSGKSPATELAKTNDVPAPSNTRAVITLADGRKVYLDSAGNGTIARENNVNVIKNSNGEISYQVGANGEQRTANGLVYNTLNNPRGSKAISLTLSDGTKVWLNSESSLKYPIAFAGNTREVEITGEAYFEVKHNSKQPFKVHLPNGSIVEDIGTSFNINSYSDADNIKTTLIEGSVRVVGDAALNTNNGILLKQGQQAVINHVNPGIKRIEVQTADVDEVMSWKNGRFQFSDASIETIMKEVSRYYDVEVVYQERVPGQFVADIARDVPVSKLLRILELTNRVHFKIEGKKITVSK